MPYRQTFVVEYPSASAAPRVAAHDTALGGKLVAAQFSDALAEIEVLRECCRPADLQRADAILAERWAAELAADRIPAPDVTEAPTDEGATAG